MGPDWGVVSIPVGVPIVWGCLLERKIEVLWGEGNGEKIVWNNAPLHIIEIFWELCSGHLGVKM